MTLSGATGWCLEANDFVLAKCVAGRDRDWEFAAKALAHQLVDPARLLQRVDDLPVSKDRACGLRGWLEGAIARVGHG